MPTIREDLRNADIKQSITPEPIKRGEKTLEEYVESLKKDSSEKEEIIMNGMKAMRSENGERQMKATMGIEDLKKLLRRVAVNSVTGDVTERCAAHHRASPGSPIDGKCDAEP